VSSIVIFDTLSSRRPCSCNCNGQTITELAPRECRCSYCSQFASRHFLVDARPSADHAINDHIFDVHHRLRSDHRAYAPSSPATLPVPAAAARRLPRRRYLGSQLDRIIRRSPACGGLRPTTSHTGLLTVPRAVSLSPGLELSGTSLSKSSLGTYTTRPPTNANRKSWIHPCVHLLACITFCTGVVFGEPTKSTQQQRPVDRQHKGRSESEECGHDGCSGGE